jgi:sulfite reductase (ferredoxin)
VGSTLTREPRPKTPPSARPQGQWAHGQTEPLNAPEALKQESSPLAVRERIEQIHAREGFASIPADDLKERLKWWGLYTQRRQDAPASETGSPAEQLMDSYFMLRIRTDGRQLTSEQLRAVAWASEHCGRDIADVTDRQNIQLHWIRIEDMPEIWRRLEAVGLSTGMACGDVPRGFLGCTVAGRDADEVLDATAVIEATAARAVRNPAYENLPRKYKTSISGCAQHCAQPEINDASFVGVRHDGKVGFDLLVGGGLGPNPHRAQRLGVFVEPEQVPDVWEAVTSAFRDHGYRRSRKRARLKFLIADIGPAEFRRIIQDEYLGYALPDLPPVSPVASGVALADHVGVFAQRDGRRYVGVAPRAGRLAGSQLARVADLADTYGSGLVALTTQQKLVVLDVEADRVEELVGELDALDLRARPHPFRRTTMACTGIEFCKLSLAETKGNADRLYRELERRLPDWEEDIRINVNGCPNSCARFQIADIGFMGCLVDGREGFLVHLGGGLSADRGFARKVRGVKVVAEDLPDYVEALLCRYRDRGDGPDGFSEYVRSLDDDELAAFASPVASPARV